MFICPCMYLTINFPFPSGSSSIHFLSHPFFNPSICICPVVFLSVCSTFHLYTYMYVYPSICISICYLSIFLPVRQSAHPLICLSLSIYVNLSIYQSVFPPTPYSVCYCLSVHLYICFSLCLSFYPSSHLSVSLFVHQ